LFSRQEKNLPSQKVLPFTKLYMKQIISFTIFVSAAICFFSCDTKSKHKLIVGKWAFEKGENKNKTDKDINDRNERSEGVIATFYDDGTFISIRQKDDYTDTLSKGIYELAGEGKFLVTHEKDKSKNDSVEVIELTDKILKVHSPEEKDTIILKRIQ
jgi:uncharacterized protein (TIGR03066 family)